MREMRLAELLCTRLCHDLTGPIGALANGAEFLSEEGFEMQGQAVELIASSASQAVARLQFYRRAYGRINDSGEASLAELKKLVEDFLQGSKVVLDWPDAHTEAAGVPVSYKMGRLLINLILISTGALLRGGTILVRLAKSESEKIITISSTGSIVKWDKDIEHVLSEQVDVASLTPRTVQAELTRALVQELSASLKWQVQEAGLEFTVKQSLMQAESTEAHRED